MATSQNGYSADPALRRRDLIVNGVAFVGGIRDDDDVETVLRYFWTEYDRRVERLVNPGCWGFSYRANANNPNSLSNHSSGTATDGNAPKHPNGVPTRNTFTAEQVAEVHAILAELDGAVRWGGDYTVTPDAMHAEINTTPAALAVVAKRIREGADDMPAYTDWTQADRDALVADVARAVSASDLGSERIANPDDDGPASRSLAVVLWTLLKLQRKIAKKVGAEP